MHMNAIFLCMSMYMKMCISLTKVSFLPLDLFKINFFFYHSSPHSCLCKEQSFNNTNTKKFERQTNPLYMYIYLFTWLQSKSDLLYYTS